MLVRQGDHAQGDIHGQDLFNEQPGDLAEMGYGEVCPSVMDGLTCCGACKEGVMHKVLFHLGQAVFRCAHGDHVHDLHILVGLLVIHKGL